MPRPANKSGSHYNDPFPYRLRGLIDEHGTKQEELAPILGVKNRQSVTGYIDGSTIPTVEKIVAVAKYYGVSADYLLGLVDEPTNDPEIQAICEYTGLSEKAVEFIRGVNRVPFFQKLKAHGLIDSNMWGDSSSEILESKEFWRLIEDVDEVRGAFNRTFDAINILLTHEDELEEKLYPIEGEEDEEVLDAANNFVESFNSLRFNLFEISEKWSEVLESLFPTRELIENGKKLQKTLFELDRKARAHEMDEALKNPEARAHWYEDIISSDVFEIEREDE